LTKQQPFSVFFQFE